MPVPLHGPNPRSKLPASPPAPGQASRTPTHRCDVCGVPVVAEHRLRVVGVDLEEADVWVAGRRHQGLVTGDLQLVDLHKESKKQRNKKVRKKERARGVTASHLSVSHSLGAPHPHCQLFCVAALANLRQAGAVSHS